MSSVASTLWVFYRGLIGKLLEAGYSVTIIASDDYNLLQRFESEYNCRVINMNIKRKVSPFSDLVCIFRLFRFMQKREFDIIHAHTPKAGMIGILAAFLASIPFRIYTLHGLPLETATGLKKQVLWMAEWLTFKCSSHRLIVSKTLANRIIDLNLCKQSDFQILGDGSACGVDRDRFNSTNKTDISIAKTKTELSIPKDSTLIGFVGRVTPDKGIDTLLEMFDSLSRQYNDLYLLIIGDVDNIRGESISVYQQRIKKHPRIKHLTFVDNIVPYYQAMDLLVLPSKREGFNYALLEAAACGIPTVTTDVTGCIDVVIDGRTGYVVPRNDQLAIEDAVLRLVKNPRLRREMGENAEQRVTKYYDSQSMIKRHIELYEQLLK